MSPLAIPNFRAFFAARLATNIASAMLVIVIGWQVYDLARTTMGTRDAAFLLGMIGLAQFLPLFALTLVVGYVADRIDRRLIARVAVALELACARRARGARAGGTVTLTALFAVAVLLGVGRAFMGPALSALAPNLVPREMLPTAIAWNSIGWQVGAVLGPPLGAFLYAVAPATPYLVAAGLFAVGLIGLCLISPVAAPGTLAAQPVARDARGPGLCPPQPGRPRRDQPRPVRGPARRGDRDAAGLCPRHPPRRRRRARAAARRPRGGRGDHRARADPLAGQAPRRGDDVRLRRPVRRSPPSSSACRATCRCRSPRWRCSARPTWSRSISARR